MSEIFAVGACPLLASLLFKQARQKDQIWYRGGQHSWLHRCTASNHNVDAIGVRDAWEGDPERRAQATKWPASRAAHNTSHGRRINPPVRKAVHREKKGKAARPIGCTNLRYRLRQWMKKCGRANASPLACRVLGVIFLENMRGKML